MRWRVCLRALQDGWDTADGAGGVGYGSRERLPGACAEGLGQQEGKGNWIQANSRLSATGNYYAFKALKLMESLLTF